MAKLGQFKLGEAILGGFRTIGRALKMRVFTRPHIDMTVTTKPHIDMEVTTKPHIDMMVETREVKL